LKATEEDLIAWGLAERGERGLSWTRRFRGAVMREAARLAEEEKAGRKPAGPPMAVVVAAALGGAELPAGAKPGREHEQLLVAVELAALPEALRKMWTG